MLFANHLRLRRLLLFYALLFGILVVRLTSQTTTRCA
jgi:hypothetical protein